MLTRINLANYAIGQLQNYITQSLPETSKLHVFCSKIKRHWPRRPLASKVKSLALASKSQFLENCPVLGSRTAVFFELLKFCRSPEKNFSRPFCFGKRLKKILKTFFLRTLAPLSLASSIPVLGLERVCPRKGCPWPWPRIFLRPWPWPRAMCPRFHLWHSLTLLNTV